MKLDLAQYRELAAFSQFGSDLDKVTQNQLNRGKRLTELLKQDQFQPLTAEHMVAILFAGTQGLLDDVKVEDIRLFEQGFHKYLDESQAELLKTLADKKALDDDLRGKLKAAIESYKKDFLAEHEQAQGSDRVAALDETEKKKAAEKTPAGSQPGAATTAGGGAGTEQANEKGAEQAQGAAR